MLRLFIYFLIIIPVAEAYTLNNNFGAKFKSNKVNVRIAGNTSCEQAGINIYDLEDLVSPANDDFWNRVPTSSLRLKAAGFTDPIVNINSGRLCAPTDDKCITQAGSQVIPPVSGIVIACNDQAANYGGDGVLAVTIPNNFSGRSIKGAVILINNTHSSPFKRLSKSDKIGVIAHEIGHAIGLGHSKDDASLMYYRTVDQRSALGEDDMRGVSFLYPMKVDAGGLLGGCGTIQTNDNNEPPKSPPFWQMGASLGLMILLVELMKLVKRFKTRTAL